MTYNGHGFEEFVIQRTAAYISQHDLHIGEMTVRETLAFSARCQGVGSRYGKVEKCYFDLQVLLVHSWLSLNALQLPGCLQQSAAMLSELLRREKEANIKPDPDIDVFMKVRRFFEISGLLKILMMLSIFNNSHS